MKPPRATRSTLARTIARHCLVVCCLAVPGLVVSGEPAQDSERMLKVGRRFVALRADLLKAHWQPVETGPVAGEPIGVEAVLRARHIREVESCAMDAALCVFHYRKEGRCLRLVTEGEVVNSMRLRSWSSACPEPD